MPNGAVPKGGLGDYQLGMIEGELVERDVTYGTDSVTEVDGVPSATRKPDDDVPWDASDVRNKSFPK